MCEEKEQETVSDEACGDQWGVHSIDKVQAAAYLKERFMIFKEERVGGRP